jgi:hypothetical protein
VGSDHSHVGYSQSKAGCLELSHPVDSVLRQKLFIVFTLGLSNDVYCLGRGTRGKIELIKVQVVQVSREPSWI